MATAQDVIDLIKLEFPGVDDTVVLGQLQLEHDELTYLFNLTGADESISLTAGTREYALDADIRRIWNADYQMSATSSVQLTASHIDSMDVNLGPWRSHANGRPQMFYVNKTNIGFYPTPSTTTSGTYPRVVLTVSRSETLVTGSTMPASAPNFGAWVSGVCKRLARMSKDERYAVYEAESKRERALLSGFITGRAAHFTPKIRSGLGFGGRTRV